MSISIGAPQGKLPSCQVCGHRESGSGDIMAFICQVTLQDHMIKVFYHFLLKISHRSTTFCGHRHCGIGHTMVCLSHDLAKPSD